jgi:predicted ATPase/class 3 adenylate cyclase
MRPEDLVRYVPAHVAKRIARGQSAVAFSEEVPAAALFADISGFTSLSERLGTRGPEGVEELTRVLNTYFGRLITAVTAHGGDVVKFAGDALLAFWPVENDAAELDRAVRIAARCALDIQESLARFDTQGDERLSLRVGVGAGRAVAASLGGVFGRYEFVLSGPAVVEATKAASLAEPGFCILGHEAATRIGPAADVKPAGEGTMQLGAVRDVEISPPAGPPQLDPSAVPSLLAYIPASIHRRLAAGQSGWLAELRTLTVLFVKLPGLGDATELDTRLSVMRAVQTELYRHEGSVNKLSVDEKGVAMLAALGLPPLSHEDDARRGALAALDIKARLDELGQTTSLGVNSGNVFCGTIGDATRCEYTLIGDVVNVSARLMQAANGRVLCGETTRKIAGERIKWAPLEPIAVKGKTNLLQVFRPIRPAWTQVTRLAEMTGRSAERSRIETRLDSLQGGDGGVLLIEGEAGIGKSTLVDWIKAATAERAIVVLGGYADPAQASTPYFAWRPIFRDLLSLNDSDGLETRRAKVLAELADAAELAPLLEPLLAIGFTDNDTTAAMFGELRGDNTLALLLRLLRGRTLNRPHLIVLEDAHWLDSASWKLAARAAEEVAAALLAVTTRPLSDPVPRAWSQLQALRTTELLALGPLNPEETLELARRRLGVESLPAPVADFLRDRAGGNPFFVQEMATALVESGRIVVTGGQCELAASDKLTALPFPDTVQGVVTSRIDRLPAPEQLTLKVASVVGRTFTEPVLADIYPIQEHRASQSRHLEALVETRLVQQEDVAYTFSHAITQDVAYGLIAPTQRRELHGFVARWYESHYTSELAAYYPLLAKHWTAANSPEQAIGYLEMSGAAALRDHASEEALEFFEQVRAMAEGEQIDNERRASWLRQSADAHYNLGHLARSRDLHMEALTLLGAPAPRRNATLLLSALREVALQTAHRFFPSLFLGRAGSSRERTGEIARAYEKLTDIAYLNNESLQTIQAALRAVNLAELPGPTPELARCYASMTLITGMFLMHGTARAYGERAIKTAQTVDHAPTIAYVKLVRGMYLTTVGAWEAAEEDLRVGIDVAQRIGDRRRLHECYGTAANLHLRTGDLTRARQVATEMFEGAARRSNRQVQVWAAGWTVLSDVYAGETEASLAEQEVLAAFCVDPTSGLAGADRIFGAPILALVRSRRGDHAAALEAANAAEAAIRTTRDQIAHYLLEPYFALAEVYERMWPDAPAEMRKRLRKVAKLLQRYALMYPVAKPALLLVRGWIASREGNKAAAEKLYGRTVDVARSLRMPMYESAARQRLSLRRVEKG